MLDVVIPNIAKSTLESMLETMRITDNVWKAVAAGELTAEEAREILDAILTGETC